MSKIAILGAAESGVGAAVLALKKGYDVFVSDMGLIKEHYKDILNAHGIEWEEGRHTASRILDAEESHLLVHLGEEGLPLIVPW